MSKQTDNQRNWPTQSRQTKKVPKKKIGTRKKNSHHNPTINCAHYQSQKLIALEKKGIHNNNSLQGRTIYALLLCCIQYLKSGNQKP